MKFLIFVALLLGLACALPPKAEQIKPKLQEAQPETPSKLKDLFTKNGTRVIQGDQSGIANGPYVVSIGVTGHQCSGVILGSNQQWVLTTAGCVAGLPVKLIRIRYNSDHANFGGQLGQAALVVVHPYFNAVSMFNDIALIKTVAPLAQNSYRASLPSQGEYINVGTVLTLGGWGVQTEESGLLSPIFRKTQIPILDYYDCNRNYQTVGLSVDFNYHICAGDLYNGGKGPCTGDIGAPLYDWSRDRIFGLASFSVGCGRPGYPAVFTRLANYRSWIDSTIANNGNSGGGVQTTTYGYGTTWW